MLFRFRSLAFLCSRLGDRNYFAASGKKKVKIKQYLFKDHPRESYVYQSSSSEMQDVKMIIIQ